ncbi:uncharacterized protein LOC121386788 [Gigantopelta aegis]|uniref:uncharacterized protein LOC121386788 n=1 Tax=Gigantopelta aegis TaxID=1735272 RepID=UPI001B88981E|nr:uncharacterized protein LOC121386788 [Gigantopelta aegis]
MTAAAVCNTIESKEALQQELRTRGLLGVPGTALVTSPTLSDNSQTNSLSSPATSDGQTHTLLGFNQKRVPNCVSASVLLGVSQEHATNNALSSSCSSSTSSLLMNGENQQNAPCTQMTSYSISIPKHQHKIENASASTQFAGLMFNPAFTPNCTSSSHTISDLSHASLPTSRMSNRKAGFHRPVTQINTSVIQPVRAFNPVSTSKLYLLPVSASNTLPASSAHVILVPAFTSNCVPASSCNFQSPPQSVEAFRPMQLPVSVVQPDVNTDQAIRHRFPVLLHRISNNFPNTTFTNPNSIGQGVPLRTYLPNGEVPASSFNVSQDVMMKNIINTDINKSNDASHAVLHQVNGVNRFKPHSSELKHHADIQNPCTLIPVTSNSQMQHASPSFSIPCIKYTDFGSRSCLSRETVTMATNKAQSSVGGYGQMSVSNAGITGVRNKKSTYLFVAGDQHVVKATTVVSMDLNDVVASQTDKTSCCDVTGDAPSLVITNVVGGNEAKKMVEISKFEICVDSSNGEMEEAEEFCIAGGSIQNVLVQGDQVSLTTQAVQLEVHIEGDVYKGKLPGSSKGRNSITTSESPKGSNSVTKCKASSPCSLENVNKNQRCSLSDSSSGSHVSYLSGSNSTNTDTISANVCSSNGITIKKEQIWCSSSIENLPDVHCPVLPSFPNSTKRDTNIREQGTETERRVVVHGITCDGIPSIQTSLVNRVSGDRPSSTGAAVASVARDRIHRQIRSKSSNNKYNYKHYPDSTVSVDTNGKDEPSGIVHMIASGVDGRKSPIDPLTCCVCDVSLSTHQRLKRHLRSHYGYDPFKCLECYKVFCNMRELDKHIPQHEGVNPFVCIHCGQCFILKRNHDVHLQLHIENSLKDGSCCVCDEMFESYGPLVDHLKTHSDAQSLSCKHCGKRLPTGIDLLIHTRSHNHLQINKDVSFSRKISTKSKRFSAKSDLNGHFSSHRADDKNDVTIDVTNSRQGIPKKTDSRDSRTMRTKRKSLTCNICGKTFEKATDIVAHRFQHVGERDADRKYECEECGSRFKRSWHLKEHQRRHTGVKYYGCSVCGEKFKRSNQMTKHKKGHFTASNR